MCKALNTESFTERVEERFKGLFDFSKTVYFNRNTGVILICNRCRNEFVVKPRHLYEINSLNHCPQCRFERIGKKNTLTRMEFIKRSIALHGNLFGYDAVKYKHCNVPVKIWCNTCKIHFLQKPRYHLNGRGCKKCQARAISKRQKHTTVHFIKAATMMHGQDYSYDDTVYVDGKTKVEIRCNKCGERFCIRPDAHTIGYGCSCRSESIGEKTIKNFLKKHGIVFEKNKTFQGCRRKRPLRFDFYLNDFNILIEYDGRQHYEPIFNINIEKKKAEEILRLQKESDSIKTEFAKKHSFELVRIKFTELKRVERILSNLLDILPMTS